jgi:hypothetical protein
LGQRLLSSSSSCCHQQAPAWSSPWQRHWEVHSYNHKQQQQQQGEQQEKQEAVSCPWGWTSGRCLLWLLLWGCQGEAGLLQLQLPVLQKPPLVLLLLLCQLLPLLHLLGLVE